MIIDSHCHLDFDELYNQLDDVINRADLNQVKYLLTICTNLKSFDKIKLIVNKYKNVYGTIGIHPHESKNFKNLNSVLIQDLQKKNKKIIGIGETGLDYYYNNSNKKIQQESFAEHIKAAVNLNIPVIVHTRKAENDTLDILKNEKKNSNLKILIHCFSGNKDYAKKLLDIGCFISISGIVTFKNSSDLVEAASYIPVDRLLVETDSPYLAPIPFRGKTNEPSFIKYTVEKLSHVKNVPTNVIMESTTKNFLSLFKIN